MALSSYSLEFTAVLTQPYSKMPLTLVKYKGAADATFSTRDSIFLSLSGREMKWNGHVSSSVAHNWVITALRVISVGDGGTGRAMETRIQLDRNATLLPVSFEKVARSSAIGDLVSIELQYVMPPVASPAVTPVEAILHSIDNYSSNDVLFIFPSNNSDTAPARLWFNSERLRLNSGYYETLFTAGFVETELKYVAPEFSKEMLMIAEKSSAMEVGSKGKKDRIVIAVAGEGAGKEHAEEDDDDEVEADLTTCSTRTFDDSDDEDSLQPSPPALPIYRIIVKDVAHKTFRGLLHYILTNLIAFAPLSSNFPDADNADNESSKLLGTSPYSLKPVSPKSLYRLAHRLEMKVLSGLALVNFESQLNESNVLQELFSDCVVYYDELRDAAMRVALSHWAKLIHSKKMKQLEEEMFSGELQGVRAGLAFELLKKMKPSS